MSDDSPERAARARGCYDCISGNPRFVDGEDVRFSPGNYAGEKAAFHPACYERYVTELKERRRAKGCGECRRGLAPNDDITYRHGAAFCSTQCLEVYEVRQSKDEERRRQHAIASNLTALDASFDRSCRQADEYGAALTQFPVMPWARADNAEFRKRAHPKLFNVVVEQWDRKTSLLLLGPTGSAKTGTIVAAIHADLERMRAEIRATAEKRGITFLYTTGFELAGCRRRSKIGDEAPLLERAMQAPLTILDELGYEPPSEEPMVLLDHRYRANLPTVVASGLTKSAFVERYGGAFARRASESGLVVNAHPSEKAQVRSAG